MKYLLIGLLLTCFSCSQPCVSKYEIVDKKHQIARYQWQNQALKESGKSNWKRYTRIDIDQKDVDFSNKILQQVKDTRPNSKSRIYKELCEYNMQFAGIFDNKTETKLIYINFFCGEKNYFNEKGDGKTNRFTDVHDGGDCYFQAQINTKTSEFEIIYINGEA